MKKKLNIISYIESKNIIHVLKCLDFLPAYRKEKERKNIMR